MEITQGTATNIGSVSQAQDLLAKVMGLLRRATTAGKFVLSSFFAILFGSGVISILGLSEHED